MRHRYITADVFTIHPLEGNPLAVFPDARGIPGRLLQRIARELNLSETVFVLPPDDPKHTRCLRIFTPAAELPYAGHPTVGTAHVLAALGEIPLTGEETRIVFEEGVGPVPVRIRSENGQPVFTQLSVAKLPETGPPPPAAADLAAMLSLQPEDVLSESGGEFPENLSTGNPFLFVPVRSRDALGRARLRADLWRALPVSTWATGVFLFCREPELPGSHLRARMFAIDFGVAEDPATGSAVTAFGGYLGVRAPEQSGTLSWVIEQGFEMGRPSLLYLEVDKQAGEITGVRVGGSTVLIAEATMEIPAG